MPVNTAQNEHWGMANAPDLGVRETIVMVEKSKTFIVIRSLANIVTLTAMSAIPMRRNSFGGEPQCPLAQSAHHP
jgi:hypothetical protein